MRRASLHRSLLRAGLAAALFAAGCRGAAPAPSSADMAHAPAAGAPSAPANEPVPAEEAGEAPAGATAEAPATTAPALEAAAGALTIGDPYFPGIGNGGYDVENYDLVLDLDMSSDELEARATVRARALHDLESFALDLYGLEVEGVRVDGQEAEFSRPAPVPARDEGGQALEPGELLIRPATTLAAGSAFEVVVRYSGTPDVRPDPSVPFLPGVGWMRSESGVYVVSECTGASSWYPCNDHPRDKATYSFRVTVAKPYVVAANGLLLEVLEQGERRTYVFRASEPMASYLVTVNVAEFGVLEAQGPRGIPVRIYHPVDATEEELAPFRRQPEVLEWLETVFGPYPFEAAGGVLSYEQLGGALECQTLPVYGRPSSIEVIVHELAHQWFGDCVSPDLWRDMWLNEGFATYAEWLWAEREGGAARYERSARSAYRSLRKNKAGSPYDPGVGSVFSSRSYTRGAMVLHGLRGEVGDEAFFGILRSWVDAHREANASTADFVRHASHTAGRDLTAFFDAWLYSDITPAIPAFDSREGAEKDSDDAPATGGG